MKKIIFILSVHLVLFCRAESGFSNQFVTDFTAHSAKFADYEHTHLGFSVKNKFVKELNELSLFAVCPTKIGIWGVEYALSSNFSVYEHSLQLAYIRSFSPRLAASFSFTALLRHFERQVQANFNINTDILLKINSYLHFTSSLRIPVRFHSYNRTDALADAFLAVGLDYYPIKELLVKAEIQQDLFRLPTIRASVAYTFCKDFTVVASVENRSFCGGFGYNHKKFQILLHCRYVQILGAETKLIISYKF
ncbi:hypothetical protein FACS1894180_2190 [Bacteroidia bacterium]|nr:hypothetical protein FACS1894180_2190 [Bacteroidia bacterium]